MIRFQSSAEENQRLRDTQARSTVSSAAEIERLRKEVETARLKERALIVAWLRSPHQSDDDKLNLYWANEIEAGEHLK